MAQALCTGHGERRIAAATNVTNSTLLGTKASVTNVKNETNSAKDACIGYLVASYDEFTLFCRFVGAESSLSAEGWCWISAKYFRILYSKLENPSGHLCTRGKVLYIPHYLFFLMVLCLTGFGHAHF